MEPLHLDKQISITASPERVFAALTEPAEIVRCLPLHRAESDGVVGGKFLLHGVANGEAFTDHGVIEVCDPPRRFRYRYWSDNHGTENRPENQLVIDYRLRAEGTGTRLEVTHDNLLDEARRAAMDGVWDFLLTGLRRALE